MLYHPSKDPLIKKIKMLQQAVDHLVLVDNSDAGTPWLATELSRLYQDHEQQAQHPNAPYLCLTPMRNLGIAAAQNLALEQIYQHCHEQDYVVFFDQDSSITSQLPQQLACAFERLNQTTPTAAVGPSFIDIDKGFIYPQVNWSPRGIFQRFIPDKTKPEQTVCALISSGMLSNIQRLKQIGPFDDALFIDYVDTDWSLKAQHQGLKLFVIPNVTMQHAIGNKSLRILGRDLSVHTPQRRYYMLRNSIIMLKKHYVTRLLGLSFIYRTLIHHLIIITLEPGRTKQLHALIKGLKDGIKHKQT